MASSRAMRKARRIIAGTSAVLVVLVGILVGFMALAPSPVLRPPPSALPARPAPAPVDPIQQYADDRLSIMTLDEKIESMFMVHLPGLNFSQLGTLAEANGIGGVILMADNIPDPPGSLAAMTGSLSAESGLPLLVGIDQEGGTVRRIWTDTADSAEQLRYLAPTAANTAFAARGALLQSVGVSVNFGIVADVTAESTSFIFDRSMGGTGADAAARVAEAVVGESGKVWSTLKHFPGHGVSPGDSHSSIPTTGMTLDEWRGSHALPFIAGIDAGAELVMFGHLEFDSVDPRPATLSPLWHNLLRDELGFDGLIITDDMSMLQRSGRPELADQATNAVAAIAAGNTILLYVGGIDVAGITAAVRNAVQAGTLDESMIDDAAHRLLVARRTLSGETGPFVHCFDECLAMID